MSRLLFLCQLVVTIIVFLLSTILIKKGENEKCIKQNKQTRTVLTIYTLVASYVLLWITCACGYPIVSVPPILAALVTMNFNWIYFILRVNKTDSNKLFNYIVLAIVVEIIVIVTLALMIPESYHSIKAAN